MNTPKRLPNIIGVLVSLTFLWVLYVTSGGQYSAQAGQATPTPTLAVSTSFSSLENSLPSIIHGKVTWGDYDNDGDVDLAITGYSYWGIRITKIYSNSAGVLQPAATLAGMIFSNASWIDYDNDNDLDILIAGTTNEIKRQTQLYRNDNGAFTPVSTPFLNVNYPTFSWGDYDSDGDQDLVLGGLSDESINNTPVVKLYRNDSSDFTLVDITLPSTLYAATWVDYDSDGDLDMAGEQAIFRNDGNHFTEVAAAYSDFIGGRIAWSDYDHDGDPDVLMSGRWVSGLSTRLYKNMNGVFVDTKLSLPEILSGNALTWADVDNDGDNDIFLAGNTNDEFIANLYLNIDNEFYEAAVDFPGIQAGTADWGDFDNDGDLDLLYTGELEDLETYTIQLYRNNVNSVPLVTATPTTVQPTPTEAFQPTPTPIATAVSEPSVHHIHLPIVTH
ncbi:MAG: VCBS repeat-containing protein [Caldilineaceae bacterium]